MTKRLLLLVGAIAGCGGETGGPNPPPPPPPPAPVVTSVAIAPPAASMFMDDTLRLSAIVRDQNGAPMTGKTVSWSSSNLLVASVDMTGRVIALAPGSTTITALVENRSATAQLTIAGPGTQGGVSGTSVVGPFGGTVAAVLPGGGTLSLAIPAAALATPVEVTLEPMVPVGRSLAAFQVSPGGLELGKPATLVVKASPGAKVRLSTVLVFEQNGLRMPVPGTPDPTAGTVTVTLTTLGIPSSPSATGTSDRTGSHAAAASANPTNGNLLNLTLDDRFNEATAALGQLQQLGTLLAADAMQFSMEVLVLLDQTAALADTRFAPLVTGWKLAVCGEMTFAANALQSFAFASDYRNLERVAGAVLGWSHAVDLMGDFLVTLGLTGCPGGAPDAETLITNKLTALQTTVVNDLNAFVLIPEPRDSLFLADRLAPLLDLIVALQEVDYAQAVQLLTGITVSQMDRIRLVGYQQCRLQVSQAIQSRLIRIEATGDAFAALSTFEEADLETDIELCGMEIIWRMLDSTGTAVGNGTVGGGSTPGSVLPPGSVSLTGDGHLELSGILTALLCPSPASANAEQLEVVVGLTLQNLTQVALLTPSNQNTYLAVSPLLIPTSALRAAAGVSQGNVTTITVVIRRVGGVCSGLFVNLSHSTIGSLDVTLVPPPQTCPAPIGSLSAPNRPKPVLPQVCPPPPPPPPPPPGGNCPDITVGNGIRSLPASSDSLRNLSCIQNLLVATTDPVDLPNLTRVNESMAVNSTPSFSAPSLSFVGSGLAIRGSNLVTLVLSGLGTVNGGFSITGTALSSLGQVGCPSVTGSLNISGNQNLLQTEAQAKANCMSVSGSTNVSGNKP